MIWLIWNKESMALESREERCSTIGCSSISYLDGWYKGAQKFNNNNRNITNGYHQEKIDSNVTSMLDSTTMEELQVEVGAFAMR
jgi:hypothetical protein